MKKFFAVLLTLSLLAGTGTAAMAKQPTSKSTTATTTTLSENSTYQFDYVLPDYVVTDKDAKLGVALKTAVLGQDGFEDAYVKFSATGPGSVNFAKDSTNTYVDQGTLADFDLSAQYNTTTNWTLKFTEDGTYNITFKLFDTNDNELSKKVQEIKVTDGAFLFTIPEKVTVATEATVSFKLITEQDYEDVHFAFIKSAGTGDVLFRAQDSDDNWYSFTNTGDLKPASFDIEAPYNETVTNKLTFTKAGTYDITYKLVDADSNVLVQGSQKVVVKAVTDEDEDEDENDEDEDNDGKGNTHGLVNAVRNHLKFKKHGKSPSESQSLNRLMELLQNRGLAQEVLDDLKDTIAELENAITELEKAIATSDNDSENFRALAKMKQLKGKKYETYIDGQKVNYADAEPILEKNRTLVPFRKLAEILGADVSWNQEKKEITVTKDDKTVVIIIDKGTATIDGKTVALDTPAKIYKNRTLVPLRFLAEAFDTTVDFYPEGSLISIKKHQK